LLFADLALSILRELAHNAREMKENPKMSDRQALLVADFVEADDEVEDDADFQEVQDFASFMREAQALGHGTAQAAHDALDLMRRAAIAADGFTSVEINLLVRTIADRIGVGRRSMHEAWKAILAQAKEWTRHAAAAARAEADAREAEQTKRRQEEERAKIWASCGALAESPTVLAEMEAVAHQLGLVNEGAGARAAYLSSVSRLLAGSAVRMLRLGASASGKNIAVETALKLIPEDAIVQVSGASPRALPYYGGVDPDALRGKVLYVPGGADSRRQGR
jgi:hypothetical protein